MEINEVDSRMLVRVSKCDFYAVHDINLTCRYSLKLTNVSVYALEPACYVFTYNWLMCTINVTISSFYMEDVS